VGLLKGNAAQRSRTDILAKLESLTLIRMNERLPFDIAANRTVYFDFDVAEVSAEGSGNRSC
jgi:hypothetical protein